MTQFQPFEGPFFVIWKAIITAQAFDHAVKPNGVRTLLLCVGLPANGHLLCPQAQLLHLLFTFAWLQIASKLHAHKADMIPLLARQRQDPLFSQQPPSPTPTTASLTFANYHSLEPPLSKTRPLTARRMHARLLHPRLQLAC